MAARTGGRAQSFGVGGQGAGVRGQGAGSYGQAVRMLVTLKAALKLVHQSRPAARESWRTKVGPLLMRPNWSTCWVLSPGLSL